MLGASAERRRARSASRGGRRPDEPRARIVHGSLVRSAGSDGMRRLLRSGAPAVACRASLHVVQSTAMRPGSRSGATGRGSPARRPPSTSMAATSGAARGSPPRWSASWSRPTTGSRGSSPAAGAGRRRPSTPSSSTLPPCERSRAAPGRGPGPRAPRGPAGAGRGAGAGSDEVVAARRRSRIARPARRPRRRWPSEVRQAAPVEVEEGLHDLAGLRLRGRVGEALDLLEQGLEPLEPAAEVAASVAFIRSGSLRSLDAEHRRRAAPRAPCRRPGTCGRRTAGTGRSCAPPA